MQEKQQSKGKYIVLEGPTGVGKHQLLQDLAGRLQVAGLPVLVIAQDQSSDITSQTIKRLLVDPRYPLTNQTEVLLYSAISAQNLQAIRRGVEQGLICLADHNYLSTLAEQYYGRGLEPNYKTVNQIIDYAVGGLQPDLCIVLDAPVTVLKERLADSPAEFDDSYMDRVRAGYLWEAKQRDFPVLFTSQSENVAEEIWTLVAKQLAVRDDTTPTNATSVKEIIDQKQLVQPVEPPIHATVAVGTTPASHAAEPGLTLEAVSKLLLMYLPQAKTGRATNKYYLPHNLRGQLKQQYIEAMDSLLELHGNMVQQLTEHLRVNSATPQAERDAKWKADTKAQARRSLRSVLPIAATNKISLKLSAQPLKELILRLLSNDLPEAQEAGRDLLRQARLNAASFMEGVDAPERGDDNLAYYRQTRQAVAQLARELLPETYADGQIQSATLIDYWPKNELLLTADMLYEHSSQPLEQIQTAVSDWSYKQKTDVFKAYAGQRAQAGQKPGPALERAHYSWDLVGDYSTFSSLTHHCQTEDLTWQPATPRYGYEIPALVETAGLTEQFEACFDLSLKLYSLLQQAGHQLEAQYATLQGHRLRWKMTYNGRQAFALHELKNNLLVRQMNDKLAEVHPQLAEAINSVN